MNELQKAYLDGASMAYTDVADKIDNMIGKAGPEIKDLMLAFKPFADSCRLKATGIYVEAKRMEEPKQ